MTEQEATDRFERLCGGVENAQRLMHLYQDSSPHGTEYDRLLGHGYMSQENVFRAKAKADGYTAKQIQAFLNLQ